MSKLKTNVQTIFRGKELPYEMVEREFRQMNLDRVYCILYNTGESCRYGIMAFGGNRPLRLYNVFAQQQWEDLFDLPKELKPGGTMKVYKATPMEVMMASEHNELVVIRRKALQYLDRVKLYEDNIWHRIAEKIRRFLP